MSLRTKCSGETQWKQKINILNGHGCISTTRRSQRQFGVGGGEQRIGLCQTIAQTWSFQINVLNKSKRKDISATWRIWLRGGHISYRTNLRCQRPVDLGVQGLSPSQVQCLWDVKYGKDGGCGGELCCLSATHSANKAAFQLLPGHHGHRDRWQTGHGKRGPKQDWEGQWKKRVLERETCPGLGP